MLKISKTSVSVILNCGLGNMLMYIANGLYYCFEHNCKEEIVFIKPESHPTPTFSYYQYYLPFGGHNMPQYKIEEFFPNINFIYNIDFKSYIKYKVYHVGDGGFNYLEKYKANVYDCSKWNYNFIKHLSLIKDKLKINPDIEKHIKNKHKLNLSYPCVHLRLGSPGDITQQISLFRVNNPEDISKYLSSFNSPFYVFSNNINDAIEFFKHVKISNNPIYVDEPCVLSSLYLMSQFKKILLAKSSLSLWVAYLSENAEITVPSWFSDGWHEKLEHWKTL
jgi:hypothetical protein